MVYRNTTSGNAMVTSMIKHAEAPRGVFVKVPVTIDRYLVEENSKGHIMYK